jgi:cyclopropane-fatty-acyl-phospholipid synthase
VRQQGFDEAFIRLWRLYLCYCEAGFDEHSIGVSQFLLQEAQP